MRIGILTFHAAHNYGAVLQCFALQEYLTQLGNDVSIIDHRIPEMLKVYEWISWSRIRSKNPYKLICNLRRELSNIFLKKKRYDGFNEFIKTKLNCASERMITTCPYDVIFVGSDQVWNTKITRGFDSFYWGLFKHPNNTRLCSYAASMEDQWDSSKSNLISKYLNNFDNISVRGQKLADKLQAIVMDKKIESVVDPTLLLDKKTWDNLCNKNESRKYILVYQVEASEKTELIARQIAHELDLELRFLSARTDSVNSREIFASSPIDFVQLFRDATFVVCSSFHGTIFSILFNRPFYSIRMNNGKDDRVESLLSSLNLLNRFISSYDECDLHDVNYVASENVLDTIVEDSKEYLQACIKK